MNNKKQLSMRFLLLILFASLKSFAQLPDGNWHADIRLNDTMVLPFTFSTNNNSLTIQNGIEKITIDEITYRDDSVILQMPVFDSEFRCKIENEKLTGHFYNHARKNNNILAFQAERGLSYRFSDKPERSSKNITGRYLIYFDGEAEESKKAVGIFNQSGQHLSGTFLTTTGDYRFLEGEINGNRMWLSAFDGSHLFLFTAIIKNDSLVNGEFFSGSHWHDTWNGVKDENATLPSAESFTKVKDENQKFDFTFPDESGKMISLSDDRFRNKAVIVQIMGSWCPNCMDETQFLSDWYNKNGNEHIEIIALDYERITTPEKVKNNIERLRKKYNINYPVLFAGSSDKSEASKTLPAIDRVFAYPTTIFLSRDKKVVNIHTGFTGPAEETGYSKFKMWFDNRVTSLME